MKKILLAITIAAWTTGILAFKQPWHHEMPDVQFEEQIKTIKLAKKALKINSKIKVIDYNNIPSLKNIITIKTSDLKEDQNVSKIRIHANKKFLTTGKLEFFDWLEVTISENDGGTKILPKISKEVFVEQYLVSVILLRYLCV